MLQPERMTSGPSTPSRGAEYGNDATARPPPRPPVTARHAVLIGLSPGLRPGPVGCLMAAAPSAADSARPRGDGSRPRRHVLEVDRRRRQAEVVHAPRGPLV